MAFANSEFKLFSGGTGFSGNPSSESPPPRPPPPPVEVLASEVSSTVKCLLETVDLDGLTLFKGRVSTKEVLGVPDSDLVPGVYEGGLKLWEGSLDLVKALRSEIEKGELSFRGKKVLELGCGHGLPGIFACLEGAATVHFQDFNAEVLRCLTIPNANANLSKSLQPTASTSPIVETKVRYFAGDWSQVHQCLPREHNDGNDVDISSGHLPVYDYDIILMAETIYAISSQQSLYELIKKCVKRPGGVTYMAAKKYYFGVGGGTRQFLSMVKKDGVMDASLVAEVADGSSNLREVWKLSMKKSGPTS